MTATARDRGVGPAHLQRLIAEEDFEAFLAHVRIVERTPSGSAGSVIKFELWDHLIDLARLFATNRLIIILKARQVGCSWLVAAYALWTAMYHPGSLVLLLSKGELEAKALLEKCSTIHQLLPPWLKVPAKGGTTEMRFSAMGSKILALPSTKDAGRSETATLVIQDEAWFHEWLEDNYAAVSPTIDEGGQLVILSTANRNKLTGKFAEIYRGARSVA